MLCLEVTIYSDIYIYIYINADSNEYVETEINVRYYDHMLRFVELEYFFLLLVFNLFYYMARINLQ